MYVDFIIHKSMAENNLIFIYTVQGGNLEGNRNDYPEHSSGIKWNIYIKTY